jgi:hypothetical protein
MESRWKCKKCKSIHHYGDVLTAKNPFNKNEVILGCPSCKAPDSFDQVCDEPGCENATTCGTPTEDGYRRTCGKHKPEMEKKREVEPEKPKDIFVWCACDDDGSVNVFTSPDATRKAGVWFLPNQFKDGLFSKKELTKHRLVPVDEIPRPETE